MALASRTFLGALSPAPADLAMRLRTRPSSFSSVRSLLSWNLLLSTSLRRTWATCPGERSENSSRAKTRSAICWLSPRSCWTPPRLPARATQTLWGHSATARMLSRHLLSAWTHSSPTRSDFSGSLRVSASQTSSTPPSATLRIFFSRESRSPPLQPDMRSFRVTSTTCPWLRTPSLTSRPPMSCATAEHPDPLPPWANAKCSAWARWSLFASRRRFWTSMKFRACRSPTLASESPTRPSSSFSKSNSVTTGAGETLSCFISSST
mmetsp:Transcript_18395/g.55272  ORF Transcript_18395/g.55272 Transcript_18395/m.55272 type:complete len:265 (-) Transcript_18395:790-1584(-)